MMNFQRNCNTVVGYFRPNWKCFSFNGSLLFLLLILLVGIGAQHQAAARPSSDEELPQDFNNDEDFRNVDNLEIHRVKMVDGIPQEDHPIIIYKEDFVSEDYVPPKNETKAGKHKRRYKDIGHRRRHRPNMTDVVIEEKSDKVLFDILPETPLIVPEDMEKPRKSHMKLVPLLPQEASEDSEPNKEELNKRPKKFHRRVRRDANGGHIVRKRNPYFRHLPKISPDVPTQVQYVYVKHSVPGKKHNGLDLPVPSPTRQPTTEGNVPISFDNRVAADENDRVIFSSGRRTTSRPASRPTESIFRDPRPSNFDFGFMNPQRPAAAATTTRTPIFTRRPTTAKQSQEESIFRDPNPDNYDFSFMNKGQQASTQQVNVARGPTSPPTTQAGISQCVWAIVNCCSGRSNEIRYSCFEQNGCYGAFWGLNPCADNVRDSFVSYVADYYN